MTRPIELNLMCALQPTPDSITPRGKSLPKCPSRSDNPPPRKSLPAFKSADNILRSVLSVSSALSSARPTTTTQINNTNQQHKSTTPNNNSELNTNTKQQH